MHDDLGAGRFGVHMAADRQGHTRRQFKHAWLSVVKSPEVPSAPRLVMPYSGVCAYERVGEKYFRVFYNQSYFSVRLGPSEALDASEDLVRDYADAAAFIPLEDKSMQKGSGKTKAGKRKS